MQTACYKRSFAVITRLNISSICHMLLECVLPISHTAGITVLINTKACCYSHLINNHKDGYKKV